MFKPYAIVDQNEEATTYEFKTIYLWVLYGILLIGVLGVIFKEQTIGIIAGVCMVFYFLTVSLQYRKLGALTRKAAMSGPVQYTGSKWSFSKPLRVTLANTNAEQSGAV